CSRNPWNTDNSSASGGAHPGAAAALGRGPGAAAHVPAPRRTRAIVGWTTSGPRITSAPACPGAAARPRRRVTLAPREVRHGLRTEAEDRQPTGVPLTWLASGPGWRS